MINSPTLIKLFRSTKELAYVDFQALVHWAESQACAQESVVEVLTRHGILSPDAIRTLNLIEKGYIQPTDAALLLTAKAFERIHQLVPEAIRQALPDGNSRIADGQPLPQSAGVNFKPMDGLAKSETPTKERVDWTRPDSDQKETPKTQTKSPRPVLNREFETTPQLTSTADNVTSIGPGTVLGKCLITGLLGKGGHGAVYSALHQSLQIPVAIKVLLQDGRLPDAALRRQLRQEARTLARLNHPNVIRVLDYDDAPVPYVIMEYVEGLSLADLIAQTGFVRTDRATDIIIQATHGLAAAWDLGIVHRDIKPGNLLVTKSGMVKLADLGLALNRSTTKRPAQEFSGIPIGTCAYMAPEQARSAHEVDFRADIYSLGATFYHAVTGRLPFSARHPQELLMKHAMEPLIPPHTLAPALVDEQTSAVIVRMMAKDPDERFPSYAELIQALQAKDGGAVTDPAASESRTPPDPQQPQTMKGSGIIGRLFQRRK